MNALWAKPQSVPPITRSRPDELRDAHEALGDEFGMLDDVGVMGDDAGDQHASLGQADVLPQRPLVLVARVGLLDQVVAGGDLEYEIDDVGERRVEGVGTVPAAPADVVAHPFAGQPAKRVVERLDPQLGPAAVVRERSPGRQNGVAFVHQHGIVDLEHDARVDDVAVLLREHVGHGEDELLLARVVLVDEPVGAGRSDHGRNVSTTSADATAARRFAMSRSTAVGS